MNRSTMAICALTFLLGVMAGSLRPMHSVMAQEKPQEQDWIIQQSKERANLDAYIFNTRAGEAFMVREGTKTHVTLKP
ncbi:MAG: hypothetical protein ACLPOO_13225 [Terriglobales bacterium]